ncbi:MAG TPA: lamin tail domain-containing protein, partial [Clostridia bacterium]|nr:lamin tail domain-containing protein [Clostridia bacterium]
FVVATPGLVISEIMYHPVTTGTNDPSDYEFIELKNVGAKPLDLVGIHFTNGIDFAFTATNAITALNPGQYLLVVKNQAAFLSRYPGITSIAGQYTGSLRNSGEHVVLQGRLQEPILDFDFNDNWYPITDGQGFSLVIRDESAPFSTWTNAASWRASSALYGSPGKADPAPANIAPILITEALTHTDPPLVDTIELHNPTANPVPIGGWFLTDDRAKPTKFRLPDVSIPAGGYWTISEAQYNTNSDGFALSSLGEEVYLFSGDGTALTGYRHGFEFGPQANGVTFGRYVTSDGREHFVTEKANTLGSANAGPQVGPIVINEVMYAPPPFGLDPDTVDEYIEVRNLSNQSVPLFDPLHTTNAWRIRGGVEFDFPPGVTMAPGSYLLVVNFDPAHDPASLSWFRSRYQLDSSVPLFGPFQGNLANEGETIGLYMPDKPEIAPSPVVGFVPYVLVEEIRYSDRLPWPANAVGTGNSLQRIDGIVFGNDPANWKASSVTPGQSNSVDTDGDGLPDDWEIANGLNHNDPNGTNGSLGDPDNDGMSNQQEYVAGTSPTNKLDYLKFDQVSFFSSGVLLEFTPRAGRTYTIERLDSFEPGNSWTVLESSITGTTTRQFWQPLNQSARFYRIKAEVSP